MNFDGSIVVGDSGTGTPAMWRNGQVVDLGLPASYFGGHGLAVSSTGSIVVGLASNGDFHGFVWTPATGPQLCEDFLSRYGLMFPPGWRSEQVTSVSDDGQTLAGWAIDASFHRQGFVATIPAPGAALVGLVLAGSAVKRGRAKGFM